MDITEFILSRGYTSKELEAAKEYLCRRDRTSRPPGRFDKGGRFAAEERTTAVNNVRAPSRAYPYSELAAARTIKHVAEVFGGVVLHVRRIAQALDLVRDASASGHSAAELHSQLSRILKPVDRPPTPAA